MKRELLVCAVLGAVSFQGCVNSPQEEQENTKDGSAGTVAHEVYTMGSALVEIQDQDEGLAKVLTAVSETTTVDIVVDQWHYDSTAEAWLRTVVADVDRGTRTRYDTVKLYDASGQSLRSAALADVARYIHIRTVEGRYAHNFDYRFEMTGVLENTDEQTLVTLNGVFDGSFEGTSFTGSSVNDVVVSLIPLNPFPLSGTVSFDRPLREIEIVFTGDNTATASTTRRPSGITRTFELSLTTGQETE
ncbi:MAG: hypothetical protein GF344_13475 [Chitinivibrionales bacterium]|nr:hypothetical protein [Chitinivibrionales bacterium]MBD3357741.1 hypothetical protein [Chitinivibrionales bacterium]